MIANFNIARVEYCSETTLFLRCMCDGKVVFSILYNTQEKNGSLKNICWGNQAVHSKSLFNTILCNVVTPTRHALDLNMHCSNNEYTNT